MIRIDSMNFRIDSGSLSMVLMIELGRDVRRRYRMKRSKKPWKKLKLIPAVVRTLLAGNFLDIYIN